MKVISITSFLVYPGKGEKNPRNAIGTEVELSGTLFEKLNVVFERSDQECTAPIRFNPATDGTKSNPVRSQIIEYIQAPSVKLGRELAHRLRDHTTNNPGLGLFFMLLGKDGSRIKIVLSRFPADQGILAEEGKTSLKLDYIERIFLKNASAYKAVLYEGVSLIADFWDGNAVDRQLDDPASYWIRGFLESDFKTTSKFGTKRLADALKAATQSKISVDMKEEIVAATILAKSQFGKATSIGQFLNKLGLSDDAQQAIISCLPNKMLIDDTFILDKEEFLDIAPLASISLDTGGILIGPSDRFDETFSRELINKDSKEYRFSTTGRIVDERLKGARK